MIVSHVTLEHPILLVTNQSDSLAPMVGVIKTILQQNPEMVRPYELMSTVASKEYDLIIMDMQAGKDSLPLLRSCKERFPGIPIIAMVPYGDVMMVESIMEHGADDYISQPISLERLKFTLRNALRLRGLLKQVMPSAQPMHSAQILSAAAGSANKIRTLKEIEDAVIDHAISACEGCITQAAKALGIGRSTLYRKMQEKVTATPQISRENQTTRPTIATASAGDS